MVTFEFKISGQDRREMKKRLSELKHLQKNFWMVEDCNQVAGCGLERDECIRILEDYQLQINKLERLLSERIWNEK